MVSNYWILLKIVEFLLESGIDADNVDGDGLTALEIVIGGCDGDLGEVEDTAVEMLGVILEAGADINREDSGGLTPLHRAARLDSPLLFAYLLERGASHSDKIWKMENLSVDIW